MAIVEELAIQPEVAASTAVLLAHGRARLVLRHPSRVGGWVDGGWWPHTSDLAVELRPLVHAIRRAGFNTAAVSYQLAGWSAAPAALTIGGRPVELRGYRIQEPDTITLTDHWGWDRIDLLVIPHNTAFHVADSALHLAGGADLRRAHELLQHPRAALPA
jgi:hypothetical protein